MGMADEVRRNQNEQAAAVQRTVQRAEQDARQFFTLLDRLAPEFADGAKSLAIKPEGSRFGPKGWLAIDFHSKFVVFPKEVPDAQADRKRVLGRKDWRGLGVEVLTDGSWAFVAINGNHRPPKLEPVLATPRFFKSVTEETLRGWLTERLQELASTSRR